MKTESVVSDQGHIFGQLMRSQLQVERIVVEKQPVVERSATVVPAPSSSNTVVPAVPAAS